MSKAAIVQTTQALKALLEQSVDNGSIHIGAPIKEERESQGDNVASLFLFHIIPNKELRNEPRFSFPVDQGIASKPVHQQDALPLDLYYLITVFRRGNNEPNELNTLGQIVQVLHDQPTLSGPQLPNQLVRITPEPYPMEEMSRIWGLFPNEVYRTSMVYLATPVYVDVTDAIQQSPPVLESTQRLGAISSISNNRNQNSELRS